MKNIQTQGLIDELKRVSLAQKVNIWKSVALDLQKPTRQQRVVNLARINRYAGDNETIIVPGKVLAGGDIKKKVMVAAQSFSGQAAKKIQEAGGVAMKIPELLQKNPQGKKVRIIG